MMWTPFNLALMAFGIVFSTLTLALPSVTTIAMFRAPSLSPFPGVNMLSFCLWEQQLSSSDANGNAEKQ